MKTIPSLLFTFALSTLAVLGGDLFRVDVSGKGSPMLLIPGLSSSGKTWDWTVAHYRDRYECHVLTLNGFAGQPPVEGGTLDKVQDAIAAYVGQKKMVKPVVVGHSLGGFIALAIAAKEPTLLGPLVIVDALPFFGAIQMPDATAEMIRPVADGMLKQMLAQTPEQYKSYLRKGGFLKTMATSATDIETIALWGEASDPATVSHAMHYLMTTDLRADISKIESPVLVLGSWIAYKDFSSRETVLGNFTKQYAALKGARIELSETGKHFLMLDEPAWFVSKIDAFLGVKSAPAVKSAK